MLENTDFNLDGINSYDMGVVNIHIDSSLIQESFAHGLDIKEEKIRGRDEPYLMDVSRSPIDIPLTIYFKDSFTKKELRDVSKWLMGDTDSYRPFYFVGDDSDRMFFVIPNGEPKITHNGDRGYIEITFRTSSPYGYSKTVSTINKSVNGGLIFEVDNHGDKTSFPEIEIKMDGSGDIFFINRTDSKSSFDISNLFDQEVVYIDSYLEDIISSEENNQVYRYDDFKGKFPRLVTGRNEIEIIGNCDISIKFRAILIQG